MSYVNASFYRRSNAIYSGTLEDVITLNSAINPAGYIRVAGNTKLIVTGISSGQHVIEEVAKLSSHAFTLVETLELIDTNAFTGKVSAVDSSGASIPTDEFLFSVPVQMAKPFLRTSSAVRGQDSLGLTTNDVVVQLSAVNSLLGQLVINDFVIIKGEKYSIRNIHKAQESYYILQAVIPR